MQRKKQKCAREEELVSLMSLRPFSGARANLLHQELFEPLRGEQTGGQPGKTGAAYQRPGGGEGAQRSSEVTAGDVGALRDGPDVLNDLYGPA